MFNLGFIEIIVLVAIGLLVLGPERFPKAVRQFLRFSHFLKSEISSLKKEAKDLSSDLQIKPLDEKPDKKPDKKEDG